MKHKHNKIVKKKLKRYHSDKRYKKVKRSYYSKYSHNSKKRKNAIETKKNGEKHFSHIKFEELVKIILEQIFPMELHLLFKGKKKYSCHKGLNIIHQGFKKAQNLIIENLIAIQTELDNNKKQLKLARQQHEQHKQQSIKYSISILEFKEKILKHLADTILWHLIQGKLHVARRFYQNISGSKILTETNYKSVLHAANILNVTPNNCVILTDITSYAQLGDLMGFVEGKFKIIEVKEGRKNQELLKDIEDLCNSEISTDALLDKYQNYPHDLKQIQRILKQKKRTSDVCGIISTNTGVDPVTGENIKLLTPLEDTIYYDEELHELEMQLIKRGKWAYTIIDDCLHIGLYKSELTQIGEEMLNTVAQENHIDHKIIVDARECIDNINTPLFCLPFSKQCILDILFGRIRMLLMLDIDKFMSMHTIYGTTCLWCSTRETAILKDNLGKDYIFSINNRGIKLINAYEQESYILPGTICKILFNHIKPHHIVYTDCQYLPI